MRPADMRDVVGRLWELLVLATDGSTHALALTGEPGVGKTFALESFLERAREAGHGVVYGRGERLERDLPFGALEHAMGTLLEHAPSTLAARVREMRRSLRSARTEQAGPGERQELVRSALEDLLELMGGGRPVVVAIDDADADVDTLAVLRAGLSHNHGLLLVAVLGPQKLWPNGMTSDMAMSIGSEEVLELVPRDEAHTAALVEEMTGIRPEPEQAAAVEAATGGNPLLVAASLEGSEPELAAASQRLLMRMFAGRAEALTLARVLSIGDKVPNQLLPLLAEAAGLSATRVIEAREQLRDLRLLDAPQIGSMSWRHPALREALYENLGPARRVRLHDKVATALIALRADGDDIDAATIAYHACRVASEDVDERAAGWATEAGDDAIGSSVEQAIDWYQRAVELTPSHTQQQASRRARHARAFMRGNRVREGVAAGLAALSELPSGPERHQALDVVLEGLLRFGEAERALALLDQEVAADGAVPRLMMHRVAALSQLGRVTEAIAVAEAVVASTDEGTSEHLLALSHLTQLANQLGDHQRIHSLVADSLRAAAHQPIHRRGVLRGYTAFLLACEGRIAEARDLLRDAPLDAPEFGPRGDDRLITMLALLDWYGGEWDRALQRASALSSQLHAEGLGICVPYVEMIEAFILANRGDIERARVVAACEHPELGPLFTATKHLVRGVVESLDNQLDRAKDELAAGLRLAGASSVARFLAATLAQVCARAGDTAEAAAHLERAWDGGAEDMPPPTHAALLLARAEVERDPEPARLAYELASGLGLRETAARAQLLRGELGDRPDETLTEAWLAFDSLNASLMRARASAALRARGIAVPRSRRREGDLLTEAERQVLSMVLDGLPNRVIADRLSYSVRTVETYLSHIYRKTGMRSRHALARAVRNGVEF